SLPGLPAPPTACGTPAHRRSTAGGRVGVGKEALSSITGGSDGEATVLSAGVGCLPRPACRKCGTAERIPPIPASAVRTATTAQLPAATENATPPKASSADQKYNSSTARR